MTTDVQPTARQDSTRFYGLLRRRFCLLPTLRGWLLFGLVSVAVLLVVGRGLHSFLAVDAPVSNGFLVVEGWLPDYGMEFAANQCKRDHHQKIYVIGGPLEYGTFLSEYQTCAQLGAATLIKIGLDSNVVQAVPAPLVRQDRTYTAALSLKKWLLNHGIQPARIQLISDGPHARRSRLLFEKAMGRGVVVGVTPIRVRDYDQDHWWRYSAGVRNVIGEGLAYLYARFLFFTPSESR